jgi:hypothetical protein
MAGRSASGTTTPIDICKVLAAKQGVSTNKGKTVKVNETSSAPATFTLGNRTYYLNKGVTITINRQQYSLQSTLIHLVGMHRLSWIKLLSTGELLVAYVLMTC